jgi:hypothetical protein
MGDSGQQISGAFFKGGVRDKISLALSASPVVKTEKSDAVFRLKSLRLYRLHGIKTRCGSFKLDLWWINWF